MPIRVASSTRKLPDAVAELKQQCGNHEPCVVIFFASPQYDPGALSKQMKEAFLGSTLVGCTTAGEICGNKLLTESVVAMFLGQNVVEDAACAVVDQVRNEVPLAEALRQIAAHFKTPISTLDLRKHVGVVLIDGLSGAEERFMEKLGDLTDLFFVGGSAGDDLKFRRTQVMANGRADSDAAVLLVLRLKKGFDILKTQSFRRTGKTLLANEVDEAHRKVIQFNHTPALHAYAEAVGVAPEKAATLFMRHPLGLMVQGEPYVRSPQRVEDASMLFYCQIKQGMKLEVLDATDIVTDTRAALQAKKRELGKIAGLIDFQCILRTLQLRDENKCDQYGEIFSGIPAVGFSTYGEEFLGHINQTSTILLFR
jgi:hypothetical protein